MTRSYRHIKEYEKEILELKSQGLTERELKRLEMENELMRDFLSLTERK